jgi:glyoxylase-like metal-dependent hydrolase (beta-lactamase superfamily II)
MKAHAIAAILALTIAAGVGFHIRAQGGSGGQGAGRGNLPPSPYPITQGRTYRFEKIADGVYYGSGGNGGNMPVVIGSRDVLVMDTGTTPAVARAFLEDLKLITDKPVRYAVNSHFHYDHTDGNQVYAANKVDIVAHEYVKYAMQNYDILHIEPYMTSQVVNGTNRIENLRKQIAEERDADKRAALDTQLATAQRNFDDLKEIRITPPNVTFKDKKVIDLGGREVQLLFLGRGHTNGDTVVYLPKEKVACTGDLMEYGPAYMGDGQFDEWIATLERMKEMDVETDLPGHGVPFKDVRPRITAFQGYLRDVVKQVAELRKEGMAAAEAAQKVDLSAYKAFFAQTARPGAELRGVRHIYAYLYDQDFRRTK